MILSPTPHPDTDPDTIFGESQCKDDYTHLTIHLTDESLGRSSEEVEVTVVHELLHALTRPWRQQIDRAVRDLAHPVAMLLHEQRSHEEEQLVDRLSRVIVQLTRHQPVGPTTLAGYATQQLGELFDN